MRVELSGDGEGKTAGHVSMIAIFPSTSYPSTLICCVIHSVCLLCPPQTVEHGFPHQPSALCFSPSLQLLAIGTRSGAIKLYP